MTPFVPHFATRLVQGAALALTLGLSAACSHGELGRTTAGRTARAEAPDLWAMTIMAGRYGVMLGQAREILKLAAPRASEARGRRFPAEDQNERAQQRALADEQVEIAAQYFADTAAACVRLDLPPSILAIACQQDAEASTTLLKRAPLDLASLEARNEALGALIMPWWDAACDYATPEGAERMEACPME